MLFQRKLIGGSDEDGDTGVKLRPTFGVSFGLPSGGGGYPLNPYQHPAENPYGGSIGSGGLDLGLVSVNPLLSLQVTKDDYGDKVVKPLVNLHVTPNKGLVHKLGSIIHNFKAPYHPYHPYQSYHHHQHIHKVPPQYYPYKPYVSHKPWSPSYFSHPPHHSYGPPSHSYAPHYYYKPEPYKNEYIEPEYDSYDSKYGNEYPSYEPYDSYNDYYRNARTNTTAQSSGKVAFPENRSDRHKRDVKGEEVSLADFFRIRLIKFQ